MNGRHNIFRVLSNNPISLDFVQKEAFVVFYKYQYVVVCVYICMCVRCEEIEERVLQKKIQLQRVTITVEKVWIKTELHMG